MTPAKDFLVVISELPRMFSLGIRQSVNITVAVSEERMPSFLSRRTTSMPGVPASTTNDLIAARPRFGSSDAHTTTAVERSPPVTKIFSPLSTHSSPSRRAVARTAAESEPASGSVIAMAAHTLPKRFFCSGVATAAMAALPRPWRGIVNASPQSPQHSSIMPMAAAMLAPLTTPCSLLSSAFWLSPLAPAPPAPPPSRTPSSRAATMSSSLA